MTSTSEQFADLRQRLESVRSRLTSVAASPLVFAHMGPHVTYGCKVTASGADMTIALEGEATGDPDHLNPDVSADPVRPYEFGNIASLKDGAFTSIDLSATVEDAPATGLGRIDIAYIYVGPNGAGLAVATGTPAEQVKTDYDNDGLSTALYGIAGDPTIPVGALPVARIYVEDVFVDSNGVVGVSNAQIADIRSFLGKFDDAYAEIAAQIATLDAISADIATLAAISGDITAVSDNSANVTTVANNIADVIIAADNSADISAVADALADIETVLANLTDIQNAEENAATATTQAGIATAQAALAAEIVNITEVQQFTNPLAHAVRVAMTASASVPAIKVLPADEYNIGTSDVTIHIRAMITEALGNILIMTGTVGANGLLFQTATVPARLFIRTPNSAGDNWLEHYSDSIADYIGDVVLFTLAFKRQSALAAGYTQIYMNGVPLGSAVAIAAGSPFDIDLTDPAYLLGGSTSTTASRFYDFKMLNRLQSDSEVLDYSINGPSPADMYASQVPVYESDFSAGVDGWTCSTNTVTGNIDGVSGVDDTLKITGTGAQFAMNKSGVVSGKIGKKAKVTFDYYAESGAFGAGRYIGWGGNTLKENQSNNVAPVYDAWTTLTFDCVFLFESGGPAIFTTTTGAAIGGLASTKNIWIKNIQILQTGITLHINAEDCQGDTAQIFDRSGNGNHALLPASGATRIPAKREFEIRWTNTWAGTHELQYVGGTNQAIFPTGDIWIDSWTYKITGATIEDVVCGDGSDADRFVTLTTGLAAGTGRFTLASNTTDGTNLKCTIDPDANFTGSIASVIRGYILE